MIKLDDILSGKVVISGYEDKILHALYFVNVAGESMEKVNKVDITYDDIVDGMRLYPVKAIMKNYKNTETVKELDINLLAVEIDKDSIVQTESEKLEIIDDTKPVVAFFEIGEHASPIGLPMKVNIDSGKLVSVDFIQLDYHPLNDDSGDMSNFVRYLNNVGFRTDYINKYCYLMYDKEDLASIIKANVFSMFMRQPLNQINLIDCNEVYRRKPNMIIVNLMNSVSVTNILDIVEKTTQEIRGNDEPVETPSVIKYFESLDSRIDAEFDEVVYGLNLLLAEENGYGKVMEILQSLTYGKLPNDDLTSYDEMIKRLNPVNAYKAKTISDNLEVLTNTDNIVETTPNSNARVTTFDDGVEALDVLFTNKLNDSNYDDYINISKRGGELVIDVYGLVEDGMSMGDWMNEVYSLYINYDLVSRIVEDNISVKKTVIECNNYLKATFIIPLAETILF